MNDLYTARVTVTGGRDGSARSDDGRLDLRLGFPPELGGKGEFANPEQLFAAGYAACFASSLKAAGKALGAPISQVQVDAEATVSAREDGSFVVSRVRLVARGLQTGTASAVIEEAKRICAYSNATRGNVITDIVVASEQSQ
jgi:lipoyl-dependent peroxiredoxin